MLKRRRVIAALIAAAALPSLTGCMEGNADADRGAIASAAALTELSSPLAVPSGIQMSVRLTSNLSSETAQTGDPWSGTVATAVMIGTQEVIPAGSTVRGVVTGAQPAARGTRAMLDLAIQDVSTGGEPRPLTAGIEAILAELPAAHPPGEAAGGARTATPIGSGTETDVVPAEKGSQVVLDAGSELVFVVKARAALR